jgi:pimeloyl-ACP methyl ester carboxylesterase
MVTQVVGVSDELGDHKIAFDVFGATHGYPVFLMHGTPGSRNGPIPRSSVLYRQGIRLICYDRPGYGESSPNPGRSVADAAHDVRAIAGELGLTEKFGIVGRSGGGPHALACGALLPDLVSNVAVLVSIAPSDAQGLDWCDGMTRSNIEEYGRASEDPEDLTAALNERTQLIQQDPEFLLGFLEPELTAPDRRIVGDLGIRRLLAETYAEALRYGADGWIDDALAFRRPWGFDLAGIDVPVLLWHGSEDVFSPVAHTRWLASQIPHAEVEVQHGAAHFDAVEVLPRVLARVKAGNGSERLRVERAHEPAVAAQRHDGGVVGPDKGRETIDNLVAFGASS